MTEKEKLLRDIETLRNSLSLDMVEAATKDLTDEEIKALVVHASWLVRELQQLTKSLSQSQDNRG